MPTIGEKIRDARIQRGLTQTDLSSDIVTPSMISQIEANKARPSYSLVSAIANRLGMPVEYFLNDLDEQFQLSAAMKLAEYHLMTGDAAQAEAVLSSCQAPTTHGLIYQDYSMLFARIYRKQKKMRELVHLLENLREQALRQQSHRLHFYVCKESGHAEFDMENWHGALYEWEKALLLVDQLVDSDSSSTLERDSELVDIYLHMHDVERRIHPERNNNTYLLKAREHIQHSGQITKMAAILAAEGHKAFEGDDAGRARAFAERAVMILETANMINQYVTVGVRLQENCGVDPWGQMAVSVASVQPYEFLQSEILEIENLLANGNVRDGRKRIERCMTILEDYRDVLRPGRDEGEDISLRLTLNHIDAMRLGGDHDQARELMEEMVHVLSARRLPLETLSHICARLVVWYAEDQNGTKISELANFLKQSRVLVDAQN